MAKRKSKARASEPVVTADELTPEPEIQQIETPAEPESSEVHSFVEDQRQTERQSISMTAAVQMKESADDAWRDVATFSTVSRNGAGLTLSRPCEIGRLISLVTQLPIEWRVYDHFSEIYPMLAVVQNCYATETDGERKYHIGVAFIGKQYPEAYKADPTQCFRLTGLNDLGLWEVVEAANQFKARKYSRFRHSFEVSITIRDLESRTSVKHDVLTRDVSMGGMSVWGRLDVKIGDRIKVGCPEYDFYTIALVRNINDKAEDETRWITHFEFEGALFPVQKLQFESPTVVETIELDDEAADDTKEGAIVYL